MKSKVLVFESITARGIGIAPQDPLHSLYREGKAMRDAVVEDLSKVADVVLPPLEQFEWGKGAFQKLIEPVDMVLLIAPELESELETLSSWLQETGKPSLGSSLAAIQLTSDKLSLAEHWRNRNTPTPHTVTVEEAHTITMPVVVKPRLGAGSTATRLVKSREQLNATVAELTGEYPGELIAQVYAPGIPASVSCLVSQGKVTPLLPGYQLIDTQNHFHYSGGEFPLPSPLDDRAVSLAVQAVACVTGLSGYVGVDLILGQTEDMVLEINPRLTTSYIGLRQLTEINLAEFMLKCANKELLPSIKWQNRPFVFQPMPTHGYPPPV